MKKTYHVIIPVQTYECYEVQAENEEEAKEIVASGDGEPLSSDENAYNADTDMNNWEVEQIEEGVEDDSI